ncbi:MAG: preprotein translocase subunit SecE [Patescibacteria group bacterium]|jgi:preprotein translocase subunit SecE
MFEKITNYFTSSYEEMKKVVWPNRKEVTSHSIIVVVSILVSMGIVAAIDYGLFSLIQVLVYNQK